MNLVYFRYVFERFRLYGKYLFNNKDNYFYNYLCRNTGEMGYLCLELNDYFLKYCRKKA